MFLLPWMLPNVAIHTSWHSETSTWTVTFQSFDKGRNVKFQRGNWQSKIFSVNVETGGNFLWLIHIVSYCHLMKWNYGKRCGLQCLLLHTLLMLEPCDETNTKCIIKIILNTIILKRFVCKSLDFCWLAIPDYFTSVFFKFSLFNTHITHSECDKIIVGKLGWNLPCLIHLLFYTHVMKWIWKLTCIVAIQ